MNKKLFVAGLSYDLTQDALAEYFAQAGTVVTATIITDKYSGRSKGFGFVEMATAEEAQEAIKKLNNTELAGRTIIVNEARPREERPNNFDNSRGGDRGRDNRNQDRRRSSRW